MKFALRGLLALTAPLAVALFAPVAQAAAGNVDAGRVKANTCMGCHGIPKYNNVYPTYRVPKIGGQSAEYIGAALTAYKSGERSHGTMHAQAASLSDQDIADIAAFIATAPKHP
ncbi:Cytochrome c553 [Solimonas aquatica]|uniref:Cytochrome c553 n=1 Tax=Solimonas aquatica TaxID=489703 RepID=A0A1H9EUT9_9GAMM|nr:c-type cytochrome [Solimonas aquatica]SEQ29415.1 Cytochrome c553 [Solimonas aquatica]